MKTALIFSLCCLTSATFAKADEWHKHWAVSPNPELHVSAGDASVEIASSSDNNSIEAQVTTRGWNIGDGGVRIIEHQNGNRLDVDIKVPETHFSWGNKEVHVRLTVPRELMADIHTGDGSVNLRELSGSVRADTGDGSISATNLSGNLDAHSGDGSVHINGRFDALKVHTQDGSVSVDVAEGSKVTSDWRVQTGDGSVSLHLPKSLAADLDLRTGDGRIDMNLPLTVTGAQTEHGVQGKLNGGGSLFLVRTGDGSISVGVI